MNKKAKLSRRIPLLLLALTLVVLAFTVIMMSVSASDDGIEVVGAMNDIKANFDATYLAQETVRADDKYVGKIQYTVYYNKSKGAIKTGYEGTPIVLYSINHPTIERIGTDDDITIIKSMLDRDYVVMVVDYLNNQNATSRDIASSTQAIRQYLRSGTNTKDILTNRTYFPSGTYPENFLAPAGYNISLFNVFWEIDKHSAEGTLEKIVENWNSDFRATKGGKLLKWATGDTVATRKAVQNDLDGNAPKWYDANGKEDSNGLYTYIKFTKAEKIEDCVDPDGSFLNMDLYIHMVYPTSPKNEVPVMALANSTGYPTTTTAADSAYMRQHSNDFLYNGYANVVFDYLWQPMARSASWGYYDGSQGITADHMNYGLMMYNDKLVNTAAMRYIRYTSLSDTTGKYKFDLDKFGVYGNSKGGWFSFLGEEVLQSELVDASKYATIEDLEEAIDTAVSSFIPERYYNGHHGETRYQAKAGEIKLNGKVLVEAGEKQPWLTYNGKEILSGCQLTNACNGAQEQDITAGHSPIFISGNMTDDYNAAYSYSVNMYNLCRELDIPLLHFEVPIGHTLTEGQDMNYNVDTYEAYFRYLAYYLKDAPISVSHTSPMDNAGNVKITDKITIYFAGAVKASEISKITVTAENSSVQGTWESSFGGTTWTFTPNNLEGSTLYTVTVPANLKGDNGVEMGTAYTMSFVTEIDNAKATSISGEYHTVTVPSFTSGNAFVFRFLVDNDAVNVAELYAVSAVGETTGEYLGSVKVNGRGTYEIDITDFAYQNSGKNVVLYLKTAKTAGNYNVFTNDPFDTYSKNNGASEYTTGATTPDGETAFKVVVKNPVNKANISYYYDNVSSIFTYSKIVGDTTIAENEGKRFIISFDIYDTIERVFELRFKTMTSRTDYGTIDYDNIFFNVKTKANAWTHVEFTYDVYESKYGFVSEKSDLLYKSAEFCVSPSGDTAMPLYFNNLKSVEVVTALDVTSAVIAEKDNGTGIAYKPAESTSPFALYNGETKVGEYAGWKAALAAYKAGYTVKLQSDYTFTNSDITNVLGNFATVNVDLGSYTITSANTKNSLLYAYAANTASTVVNVTGGAILLSRTPLVSYESSTSAGSGKTFNFNLNGTYIGFVDNAFTTEVISARSTTSGVTVNSNIALNGCIIDTPDYNHANDQFAVLTSPTTTTLKVKYSLVGGEFRFTSQRWITLSENANIADFSKDTSGSYTKLVVSNSFTYDVEGSYLNEEGYAVYKKASVSDNMATYTLAVGANSTRYGVITDTYMDASAYPFVVFKDGNLIGGYSGYKAAMTAAASALTGAANADKEVQVLMRADQATTEEVKLDASVGTIVVDLGGFTLLRDKNPALMEVNGNSVFDYATGILYKNGRFELNHSYNASKGTYSAGVLGATHIKAEVTQVKTFNVTYENITFGFADGYYANLNVDGLLWTVWPNSYKSKTITNFTLTDCVFDFTKNVPTGKSLINAKDGYADFNIAINGGEIKGDASAFALVVKNDEDTFVLGKNSKGEYLKLAANAKPVTDNFFCDDGVYRCFQKTESGYELLENELSTKYGDIPEANGNNKFVIFSDGKFVSGHDTWAAATNAAGNLLNGQTAKKAVLLVRDHYTNTNDACNSSALGNCNGELTIDLGGHTLTRAKMLLDFSYQSGNTAPANVIIKNGTLLSNGSAIFANQINKNGPAVDKIWNVTVENVTLGFAAGASQGSESFWASWTNPTSLGNNQYDLTTLTNSSTTNLTFNDCTFDFKTVAPPIKTTENNDGSTTTSYTTLFDFTENKGASNVIKVNATFNGGKILTNDLAGFSKVTLWSVNSNQDTVTFGKNKSGKYTTMITPTTKAYDNVHYTGKFNTPEGTMYFVEMADDGVNSTYELGKMAFEYGSISVSSSNSKFLSAVDYPFVTFANGAFKAAYGSFKAAINGTDKNGKVTGVVSYNLGENDTVYIVQRIDHNNTNSSISFNEAKFKIVVDLCGFTLTNSDKYLIDVHLNYSNANVLGFKSSIEFKNGTLLNNRPGKAMFTFGSEGKNADYDTKEFDYIFTNITFKGSDGCTKFIEEWGAESAKHNGDGVKVNYVFDGCTFDFTGLTSSVILVKATNKYNQPSVVIKGGTILADSFANYTLYSVHSDATAYIAKDDNGNYLKLIQLSSSAIPTTTNVTLKNSAGTSLTFGKISTSGSYTTYILGEPISSKYGYIPFSYHSAEDYPFVYFDENGNFKFASAFLYGPNDEKNSVVGQAKDYMKANNWNGTSYGDLPKAAFILMRRDYAMASNETFNNLSQIQGIITIDLGGFTLTAHNDKPVFPATIKPWTGSGDMPVFNTQFDVINGEIVIGENALIKYGAWDASGNDVSGKQFDFVFTNVKFTATSSMSSMFLQYYQDKETPEADATPELTFNGCTFDLTSAKSGAVLFNLGNGYIHTSVTVMGSEIIAKNTSFVMSSKNEETTSELTFGKYNGKCVAITLPKGVEAPKDVYVVDGINCIFAKACSNGENVSYTLRPEAIANYKIQTSVTLYSNFVYNVYIPTANVTSFTINGKTAEYTTETIDGVEYYCVAVNLPASESLDDIKVTITLEAADTSINMTWTLSVLKYAKSIIAGNYSATTKTLMKNMLAYASSAHTYFDNTDTVADKLEEIKTILSGYNVSVPTGEAVNTTTKTYFDEVAIYLGEVPSFRFYLNDNYTAEDFAFTVGERNVSATLGNDNDNKGDYLEVVMYAYMMCDTVSYTVNGVTESYNIFAYYDYAKNTLKSDAVVAIVEALMKYSVSAAAYRNAVIGA